VIPLDLVNDAVEHKLVGKRVNENIGVAAKAHCGSIARWWWCDPSHHFGSESFCDEFSKSLVSGISSRGGSARAKDDIIQTRAFYDVVSDVVFVGFKTVDNLVSGIAFLQRRSQFQPLMKLFCFYCSGIRQRIVVDRDSVSLQDVFCFYLCRAKMEILTQLVLVRRPDSVAVQRQQHLRYHLEAFRGFGAKIVVGNDSCRYRIR